MLAQASPLTGATTIRFTLKDPSRPLVLDFETSREHITSLDANGRPAAFTYVNGHIVVPPAALVPGPNALRIVFEHIDIQFALTCQPRYCEIAAVRSNMTLLATI